MTDEGQHGTDTLPAEIGAASSTWEIRLRMAARGWRSNSRVTDHSGGRAQFQIWFARGDWYGYLTDVTIHGGCGVDPAASSRTDVDRMLETVRAVAARAARGWIEFPDSIPCQALDGTLVRSEWNTKRDIDDRPHEHPRGRPTERMPRDMPALWRDATTDGDMLCAWALALSALGAVYTDDLTPWRWSSAGWHLDRKWGFEHGVSFPKWNGTATDCRAVMQSTPDLSSVFADALLDGTHRTFSKFLGTYYPESPHGAIPPCLRPSNMPTFDQENARRLAEVTADPRVLAGDEDAEDAMAEQWEMRRLADPILSREMCVMTAEHVRSFVECSEDTRLPAPKRASR